MDSADSSTLVAKVRQQIKEKPSQSNVVLVTGAGGFIGSAVVRQLVIACQQPDTTLRFSDGEPVQAVVAMLRPGGSMARLEELQPSGFWRVEHVDLCNQAELAALLQRVQPRVILHLAMDPAAHGELTDEQQKKFIDAPLKNLFLALKGVAGGRIVTTGSVAVLQPGEGLDENSPFDHNPAYRGYAENKQHEEKLLTEYGTTTGVPWIHLRLFFTFGKYESPTRLLPHIVSCLLHQRPVALSEGTQVRDFSDVDEVALAYLRAVGVGDESCAMIYHIGSGRGISIRDFAEAVTEVVGQPQLLEFGTASSVDQQQPCIVSDASLALQNLGWSASKDTAGKVRQAAEWWLQHIKKQL